MTNNIRIEAKKSLGQNWLNNPGVLDRIVAAADVKPTDTVVEIGPGRGALTERLVATGAKVIAIEKDHRLLKPLREQFPTVEFIEGDILEITPPAGKIVANIPYYLTSHLIRKITEEWRPEIAVLMVQEEVARRMMATAPDMNLLALSVQLYTTPSIVMRVSRGSFRPIPTVDSAVIALVPKDVKGDPLHLLEIAKKAFGQKRKQLKATVSIEALERAGIPPAARPQELSVDDWRRLVK